MLRDAETTSIAERMRRPPLGGDTVPNYLPPRGQVAGLSYRIPTQPGYYWSGTCKLFEQSKTQSQLRYWLESLVEALFRLAIKLL
jgi:hypothetical protein